MIFEVTPEPLFSEAGLLFSSAMQDKYVAWARNNPIIHTPFLCQFYPILEKNDNEVYKWHPAISKLADEFGSVQEFREALSDRLHPNMWSGSIVPHLKKYLKPLKEWFNHPVQEISFWAREQHRNLQREIERQQ